MSAHVHPAMAGKLHPRLTEAIQVRRTGPAGISNPLKLQFVPTRELSGYLLCAHLSNLWLGRGMTISVSARPDGQVICGHDPSAAEYAASLIKHVH